nr:MAG TPA: hypothetical protein [Caudoviricetes sp.]
MKVPEATSLSFLKQQQYPRGASFSALRFFA